MNTDRESAEQLANTVEQACLLLADYNGRLAAELEDRRQLGRMLADYTRKQREALQEKERKLEVWSQTLVTLHLSFEISSNKHVRHLSKVSRRGGMV